MVPIFHHFDGGGESHNNAPYPFNISTPNQTRPWVIRFILCIQATLEKKNIKTRNISNHGLLIPCTLDAALKYVKFHFDVVPNAISKLPSSSESIKVWNFGDSSKLLHADAWV